MTPVPIIIDTDIGDDVDDALAIAIALRCPELTVRAVTTVFGPVETRAQMARKLLQAYDREDIPVGIGRSKPLIDPVPVRIPNQAVVLNDSDRFNSVIHTNAVRLIVDTVRDSEQEITLVPIGALTNIACALLAEPEIIKKARIVLMGGVIASPLRCEEYNVRCDPEAARIVFESGARILMVGLDVTMQCQMSQEQVNRLCGHKGKGSQLLALFLQAWINENQRLPILHDPLAMVVAFRPDLVKTELRRIAVETGGEVTRGFTVPVKGEPNAEVCLGVDCEAFVSLFMERLLQ